MTLEDKLTEQLKENDRIAVVDGSFDGDVGDFVGTFGVEYFRVSLSDGHEHTVKKEYVRLRTDVVGGDQAKVGNLVTKNGRIGAIEVKGLHGHLEIRWLNDDTRSDESSMETVLPFAAYAVPPRGFGRKYSLFFARGNHG